MGVQNDKERYYLLWKELGVVDQLIEYGSCNTSTESVVIGKCVSMPMRVCSYLIVLNYACTDACVTTKQIIIYIYLF